VVLLSLQAPVVSYYRFALSTGSFVWSALPFFSWIGYT